MKCFRKDCLHWTTILYNQIGLKTSKPFDASLVHKYNKLLLIANHTT